MAKHAELVRKKEEEIAKLLGLLSEKSGGFEEPKLILIGGYGLRVFIPFVRSTRDCDFALRKDDVWHLDEIKKWFAKEVSVDTLEKKDVSGYMRCVELIKVNGRQAKVSLDFMEGEVTGRSERDRVKIDERFVADSKKTRMVVADKELEVRVPSYRDYFLLKIVSARPSDVRDVATLVWKNGVPKGLEERIKEVMPHPEVFKEKLAESILPIMRDKRFLNSWKGMFMTDEFDEEAKKRVIEQLSRRII